MLFHRFNLFYPSAFFIFGDMTGHFGVARVHISVCYWLVGTTSRFLLVLPRLGLFIMSCRLLGGTLSTIIICFSLQLLLSSRAIPFKYLTIMLECSLSGASQCRIFQSALSPCVYVGLMMFWLWMSVGLDGLVYEIMECWCCSNLASVKL